MAPPCTTILRAASHSTWFVPSQLSRATTEQLNRKLDEKMKEYLESGDLTELADIVEVVHGIVTARGVTVKEFENLRLQKCEAGGGFEERVFLVNVE